MKRFIFITTWALAVCFLFPLKLQAQKPIKCPQASDTAITLITDLSYPYPAIADQILECSSDRIKISHQLQDTDDHYLSDKIPSSEKGSSIIALSGFSLPFYEVRGSLKPLDALIKKYGFSLPFYEQTRITIANNVVALASHVDITGLLFRKDILKKLSVELPPTLPELISLAQKFQPSGEIQHLVYVALTSPKWIGQIFIDLLLSQDASLFDERSVIPKLKSEQFEQSLVLLKSLFDLMPADFTDFEKKDATSQLLTGRSAIAIVSLSDALKARHESKDPVSHQLAFVAMLPVDLFTPPATTLRWSGLAILGNTLKSRDVAYQAMMRINNSNFIDAQKDHAAWLHKDYQSDAFTQSVIHAQALKSVPYPISLHQSLLHITLGEQLPRYLKGELDINELIKVIEDGYLERARTFNLL